MTFTLIHRVTPPAAPKEARFGMAALGAVVLSMAATIPWGAAGAPDTAARTPAPRPRPELLSNPAEALAAIADHLGTDANLVLLNVGGLPITQGDVADVIRTMPVSLSSLGLEDLERRALDVLVRQKAMVLKARQLGLDKDPAVIRQTQVAFERVLADAWLTRTADAAVTEAATRARYGRDVAGKPGPDEVRARVILVATAAEARTIIEQARSGEDFADLARRLSKDPSAVNGGDLGYIPLEAVSPEVGSAMFTLAPGQVSPYPVSALAGYFVVRVEGRRQRGTPTFEEARARLARGLRAEAVRAAIGSLLADIKPEPPAAPPGLAAQTKR